MWKSGDDAIDLLKRMLQFDISKRITVEDALKHSYFEACRDLDAEKGSFHGEMFEFEIENDVISIKTMRQLIFDQICHYFQSSTNKIARNSNSNTKVLPQIVDSTLSGLKSLPSSNSTNKPRIVESGLSGLTGVTFGILASQQWKSEIVMYNHMWVILVAILGHRMSSI